MLKPPVELTVVPGKTAVGLGLIVAFLVLAHVGAVGLNQTVQNDFTGWLLMVFHLDVEGNVPSFFAGSLWVLNAFLFFLAWKTKRLEPGRAWRWLFLAGLFCFLAFDELSSIHEHLVPLCRSAFGASGIFSCAWILPYGLGVLLLAALMIPMVWKLPPKIRFWFLASAFVFVVGSIGMEICEGSYLEDHARDLPYFCLMTVEETSEMAGLVGLVYASLLLLERESGGISIHLPGARGR
jgi:hypothetical protein